MTTADLSTFIKNQALELGFEACGIARADRISESEVSKYNIWLERQFHAGMQYMEKNSEKRYDPRLLMEDCRSVIVVALNYEPETMQSPNMPQIARFAYGEDYHGLIRTKLRVLLQKIIETGQSVNGRAFADSAPIAERYWANQAGLGWIGKNRHLIIPEKGSCFLLGALLINIDLDYDTPVKNHCGQCRRCLDACPTKALSETSGIDANRCLSYLTIEKRGAFNIQEATMVGENNRLFGCDLCQEACPWNRFATGNHISQLQPKDGFLSLKMEDLEKMTEDAFKVLFAGTCLERTGYEGFIRNLNAIKKSGHLFR